MNDTLAYHLYYYDFKGLNCEAVKTYQFLVPHRRGLNLLFILVFIFISVYLLCGLIFCFQVYATPKQITPRFVAVRSRN